MRDPADIDAPAPERVAVEGGPLGREAQRALEALAAHCLERRIGKQTEQADRSLGTRAEREALG